MMFVMRFAIGLAKAAVLLTMVTMWFDSAAYAQTAREFGAKVPTVRLCPATCVAVNGHGMKAGGKTTVYETRSGWARVSGYLKRADLVKSFGNTITQKPALWVPVAQLKGVAKAEPAAKKNVAKKPAAKRTSIVDRVARLRRVPLPKFRPGTTAQVPVVEEVPVVVTETQPVVNEPVTEVIEETKPAEIVDSEPVVVTSKGEGSSRALTWEELQAKLAEQQSKIKNRTVEETKAAEAARLAEEKRRREEEARRAADAAAQAKATKAAADKEAAERTAKLAAEQELARKAEEDRLKKEEEARLAEAKKTEAEKAADATKAAEAAKIAEAAKVAQAEKERLAAEEAKKAADAAKVAALANQPAKVEGETKAETGAKTGDGTVGYNPPKAEDEAPKSEEVAVVLPPKKAEEPEPVYKSATADPIAFGERPKKLTKALQDKRLNKLPGRKSKVRKDVVIALRHYALGLLNSGECKGIARGGASSSPGMLYVACSDDPTYLRQFPLKEESW